MYVSAYGNVKIFNASQEHLIRYSFNAAQVKTDFAPLYTPAGSKAIIANIYMFASNTNDHFVCTFGRQGTALAQWGIDVYNSNGYQNDVIVSYQVNKESGVGADDVFFSILPFLFFFFFFLTI